MILKPGKPEQDPSSYRPISLLPSLSKVFERLFTSRLVEYMDDNKTIPDHQFGFRSGHSTIEQLHRVVNHILKAFDHREYCNGAFLDIQQAFDRVWHLGLLAQVKQALPANHFSVIRSFLAEREFVVQCRDATSSSRFFHAGVPQGSVLGPLLYAIYTADTPTTDAGALEINREKMLLATFADDVCVLYSSPSEYEAADGIQQYLELFEQWAKRWNLGINAQKSTNVCFALKQGLPPAVYINNTPLEQPRKAKYLVLTLDSRLTFRDHIASTIAMCNAKRSKLY